MNQTFNRRTLINAMAAAIIAALAFSAVTTDWEPAAVSKQQRVYADASRIQQQVNIMRTEALGDITTPAYPREARLMVYEANCRSSEISYAKSQPIESHLAKDATVWACHLSL